MVQPKDDVVAEAKLVAKGYRWLCCDHCPDDHEKNMHPDPVDRHQFYCDTHQTLRRGRVKR